MIRKFKALGVALVAVFALSAVGASAAWAVEDPGILNAEGSEVAAIHGEQVESENHVFTLTDNGNLTTKCTGATFTGTLAGAGSSSPEVTPEYTGCTAFGLKATITNDGCKYKFTITGTLTSTSYDGHVHITCETGKVITITAGTCEVQVGAQGPLSTIEATNMEGTGTPKKMDVTVHAAVKKIHYKVVKDGFLCPLTGEGKEFTEGDYTGTTTVTAKVNNTPADLTVDMGAIT